MKIKPNVVEAIYRAIDEVNAILPEERKLIKSEETALYGREGSLDSLGLVNLIVAVERCLADEFGLKLKLDDEETVSHHSSPFISVRALAAYITSRLEENKAH